MKSTNLPSGALRHAEVGLVWKEVITNGQGDFLAPMQGSIRVRATGATTVTIGGMLAMTMSTGEIAILNVGTGPTDNRSDVLVEIGGANAFVQLAKEIETGRRSR